MRALKPSSAGAKYKADGFYLLPEPIIDKDLIQRVIKGMDAVRAGEYETGVPPRPSFWNPGDDPKKLCKIKMSQIANRAIMELVSHPAIGKLAAEITGAQMVQVWWVQLLYKPPVDPDGVIPTNVAGIKTVSIGGCGKKGANFSPHGLHSAMSPRRPAP
jgi:hypothetical protein